MWEWGPAASLLASENAAVRAEAAAVLALMLELTEEEGAVLAGCVAASAGDADLPTAPAIDISAHDALRGSSDPAAALAWARAFLPEGTTSSASESAGGAGASIIAPAGPHAVSVGGVLVQREGSGAGVAASGGGAAGRRGLVETETVRRNMVRMATALSREAPILVEGASGAGKTALVEEAARWCGTLDGLIRIHLDDGMDSKTLIGAYACTETPGEFVWRPGALTQAVMQGRWVLIEDLDLAPLEVLASLIPLLDSRRLFIPARDTVEAARPGFRLIATRATARVQRSRQSPGWAAMEALTLRVGVESLPESEMSLLLAQLFPAMATARVVDRVCRLHHALLGATDPQPGAPGATTEAEASVSVGGMGGGEAGGGGAAVVALMRRRVLTTRDLLKVCSRISSLLAGSAAGGGGADGGQGGFVTEAEREGMFREAADVICNGLPSRQARLMVARRVGAAFSLPEARVEHLLEATKPKLVSAGGTVQVGRVLLSHAVAGGGREGTAELARHKVTLLSETLISMQALEAVAAALSHKESVLLTGETGTGKTSIVQHLASQVGRTLVVVNLNQQSDTADLIGGFKPVEVRQLAQLLLDSLFHLLPKVTSKNRNQTFLNSCKERFEARKWRALGKLLAQAVALVEPFLVDRDGAGGGQETAGKAGKRKSGEGEGKEGKRKVISVELRRKFAEFGRQVREFGRKVEAMQGKVAFSFVDGVLVQALKEGHWLLLDEINLAPSETLERLSGLLDGENGSIVLTERGDTAPVQRHPDFRLLACMNPPTDVGKKDLPPGLRARFTELFVDEIERQDDLADLVRCYLTSSVPPAKVDAIVKLYLAARALARSGEVYDGAKARVHLNLRSLTRMLQYVKLMLPFGYAVQRSLFEGACMVFATQLHPTCGKQMESLITRHLAADAGPNNPTPVPAPAGGAGEGGAGGKGSRAGMVEMGGCTAGGRKIEGFWLKSGVWFGKVPVPKLVMTPQTLLNLRNVARAAAPHRFPILLQGPTSAGKTSLVEFMAASTGHRFVRINNHAHTDVQEYLGGFVTDQEGRLVFQEGPLVKALRGGDWLVLDELNLAPSEVLEMLNRLLDDNRELFLADTQETVKPHPGFMLFATQNPAGGAYGGRKVMSRAFRNRFLEVHVDTIPEPELKMMVEQRCQIAPSRAERIVQVMQQLHRRRQRSNVFAGGQAFVTARDLFKLAERFKSGADDAYSLLAAETVMLLSEGLRRPEEKALVVEVVQDVMKVRVELEQLYAKGWDADVAMMLAGAGDAGTAGAESVAVTKDVAFEGLVLTKGTKRMLRLVARCMRFEEPCLLVGETGTGKTSVCQALASSLGRRLHILNCHQNTETADLIGGYRPVRGKEGAVRAARAAISAYLQVIPRAIAALHRVATEAKERRATEVAEAGKAEAGDGEVESSKERASKDELQLPVKLLPEGLAEQIVSGLAVQEAEVRVLAWAADADTDDLIQVFEVSWDSLQGRALAALPAAARDSAEQAAEAAEAAVPMARALFTWYDGPLVTAMREGDVILLDEISLAQDSVLERINSVLEPSRSITLAERGGEVIVAHPSFRALATMNPGGDFGKKELSPALRNRFTEVWVDAFSDPADLRAILEAALPAAMVAQGYGQRVLDFWLWLAAHENGRHRTRLSLRDLTAWGAFLSSAAERGMPPHAAFLHGAAMVLLDGLGIGDGSSEGAARRLRDECAAQLVALLPPDLQREGAAVLAPRNLPHVERVGGEFRMGPFAVAAGKHPRASSFSLQAPTTAQNLLRVMRGLQLNKAILLEGSPGVGKTTLIEALAKVAGHQLVRINLSDQTDMMDLLGTDLPVDSSADAGGGGGGGGGAHFAWCDGVLLAALKAGHWVLLDELNLAPQAVLEGLNAMLDHRAEVYLPELGQSFPCPPSFRIFAAQNPVQQGGGRKGLPKSFLSRFTSVRFDELTPDDVVLIVCNAFPEIPPDTLRAMIAFNTHVQRDACGRFAAAGRPWEFNLRDVLRWCALLRAWQRPGEHDPVAFVPLLYSLRLRTDADRTHLLGLLAQHFPDAPAALAARALSTPFRITPKQVQIGQAWLPRAARVRTGARGWGRGGEGEAGMVLRGNAQAAEALASCVRMGWMGILIGPPASGKTTMVRALAGATGNVLREVAVTSDTDTTDLLGCFEQVDLQRRRRAFLAAVRSSLAALSRRLLLEPGVGGGGRRAEALAAAADLNARRATLARLALGEGSSGESASGGGPDAGGLSAEQAALVSDLLSAAQQAMEQFGLDRLAWQEEGDAAGERHARPRELDAELQELRARSERAEASAGRFEWVDGVLLQAMTRGEWVLLDNVNLCNPTVLDRLNPLLEPDGVLMVNERGLVQGQTVTVAPHRDFRLFLAMDPARGSISRAMRNRGLEIALLGHELHHPPVLVPVAVEGQESAVPCDLAALVCCATPVSSPVLAKLLADHHRMLSRLAAQTRGGPVAGAPIYPAGGGSIALSPRLLLKWAGLLAALLPRGVPLRQAWAHATELVYTSAAGAGAAGGGDWATRAAEASAEYLEREAPRRLLSAGCFDARGAVQAASERGGAPRANILADCSALASLLRAALRAGAVGAAEFAAIGELLGERRGGPAPEQVGPDGAGEESWRGADSVAIAAMLVAERSTREDWKSRCALLGKLAALPLPPDEVAALEAVAGAMGVLAEHPLMSALWDSTRGRVGAEADGAAPDLSHFPWDLRGHPLLGGGSKTRGRRVLMAAAHTLLRSLCRRAANATAIGPPVTTRRGAAGASAGGAVGGAGGGVEEAVGWMRSLVRCLEHALPTLLAGVACASEAEGVGVGWSEEAVDCAGRLDEAACLMALHLAALDAAAAAAPAAGAQALRGTARAALAPEWVAQLLVLWRRFSKTALPFLDQAARAQLAPNMGEADSGGLTALPREVCGLVGMVHGALPAASLAENALWVEGGHPACVHPANLRVPRLAELSATLRRAAAPLEVEWGALGAMEDGSDAEMMFPLAVLCTHPAVRRTLAEAMAATDALAAARGGGAEDAEALGRLEQVGPWAAGEVLRELQAALGVRQGVMVHARGDGLAGVPLGVVGAPAAATSGAEVEAEAGSGDAATVAAALLVGGGPEAGGFAGAWKAALWPGRDHAAMVQERGVLARVARLLAPGEAGGADEVGAVRAMLRCITDHSSRAPHDAVPYQRLLWLLQARAGPAEDGARPPSDARDVQGVVLQMLVAWHARAWNASFAELDKVTMAPVLPYDWRPSKRAKALAAQQSKQRSRLEELQARGLGPLMLHMPVQTLHVQHLCARWARVSVGNRADAVLQMRAAAALLLNAPGAGGSAPGVQRTSAWREEWALLREMLAQLALSHARLLPHAQADALAARLAALRSADAAARAVSPRDEVGSNQAGKGDEAALFAGCRDARAGALLVRLVAPALALVTRWTGAAASGGAEEAQACGQAWGLVGLARLQLLVGEHAVDPAAKFAVKLAAVEAETLAAEQALRVRRLQAALHPGGWGRPEEARLEKEAVRLRRRAERLRLKVVARPAAPTFEELHAQARLFAETVAGEDKVRRLLALPGAGGVRGGGAEQAMEEEQFQQVAGTFCARLARDFAGYADVAGPLALAALELRLGLRLVAFHAASEPARPDAAAALASELLQVPFSFRMEESAPLLCAAQEAVARTAGSPEDLQTLRCLLQATSVAVANEGSWRGGAADALDVVSAGFAQLWAAKQEAARAKREAEEQAFKYRERAIEVKSEDELHAEDYARTFVDFSADFADLEVARGGDPEENIELQQAQESVAQRREEEEAAAAARRAAAAAAVTEEDLAALFFAADAAASAVRDADRARREAQRRRQQLSGPGATGSAGAREGETACAVAREELVRVTLDRYALAAGMVGARAGELCGAERTAGWSAAHLIVVGADFLSLTAKVGEVGEPADPATVPAPVPAKGGAGAAGAVPESAAHEGLAINALGIAAGEARGVRFAAGTRGGSGGGRGEPRDIFYTSGDASEARLLLKPIAAMAARLAALLLEFPEHSILEQLQGLSQRLLAFPLDSPLARLLTGLELLHRKALEWESYAARHVSIQAELEGVEQLIMRWHRLLVHTWPAMLVERARRCTRPVASSFLSIASVLQARADEGGGGEETGSEEERRRRVAGGYTAERTKTWKEEVHTTLRGFLEQGSLGDIAARMDLLRVLLLTLDQRARADADARAAEGGVAGNGAGGNVAGDGGRDGRRRTLRDMLVNVMAYYAQFLPALAQQLTGRVAPIEREYKDLVKIVKWENKDYAALKQNMERAQRQLHKLLRKYEEALGYGVRLLLEQLREGGISRFWQVDRQELAPPREKRTESKPDELAPANDDAAREAAVEAAKAKAKAKKLTKRARMVARRRVKAAERREERMRAAAAEEMAEERAGLRGHEAARAWAERLGQRAAAPKGKGARLTSEETLGVLLQRAAIAAETGARLGVGAEEQEGGGGGSFGGEAVEEAATEVLLEAEELRDSEAATTPVKKRALGALLAYLTELGLESRASAIPAPRRLLESMLEGCAPPARLPDSFLVAATHAGGKRGTALEGDRPASELTDAAKAERYFMRAAFLLSKLREAGRAPHKDLSSGELSKATGLAEHMLFLTTLQRESLAAFTRGLADLRPLALTLARLLSSAPGVPAVQDGLEPKAQLPLPRQRAARAFVEGAWRMAERAGLAGAQLELMHDAAAAACRSEYAAARGNAAAVQALQRAVESARLLLGQAGEAGRRAGEAVLVTWAEVEAAEAALCGIEELMNWLEVAAPGAQGPGADTVALALANELRGLTAEARDLKKKWNAARSGHGAKGAGGSLRTEIEAAVKAVAEGAAGLAEEMCKILEADKDQAGSAGDSEETSEVDAEGAGDEDEVGVEAPRFNLVAQDARVRALVTGERVAALQQHAVELCAVLAAASENGETAMSKEALEALAEAGARAGAACGVVCALGEEVLVRARRFHRGCAKMGLVLVALFTELITRGFCKRPGETEQEEGETEEGVEGMGMGEGEGSKNVSDEIEDEEQLVGAEQEGQEKQEEKSEQKREEGEASVEMEQDFEGELDDVDKEDDKEDEDDDDDKEEVDREMGEVSTLAIPQTRFASSVSRVQRLLIGLVVRQVGSDEEQVLDERAGDKDLDDERDKDDDKCSPPEPKSEACAGAASSPRRLSVPA